MSASTTSPGPQPVLVPPDASVPFTHRQILVILSGLLLGMFLSALDQTIVSTSIRTIGDDLHGLSVQAWVTTAYLITSTISTPLYGKLSDQYGRRPLFLTAISIFVVGSLACSFATSMYELAAFRALQGLGAGGLMSLALTILGDIVAPRQRAKYQGYFLAVFGSASVLGPLIGGALAGQSSILGVSGWRWVFLVNVPIGIVTLAVAYRVLVLPHTPRKQRLDVAGALTITLGLLPLLVIAEQGRSWGWTSGRALACYLIGVLGLGLFLLAEHRAKDDALIPLRLFSSQTFSVSSAAAVLIGAGMFGGISLLPQYLQIVKGASPTEAGLLTLALVLGLMVGSVLSGQLTSRTGRYKIFPVVGSALMVGALLLFHYRVGASTPLWETDVYMAMFGFGLGNCMQTLTLAVQNAVPARDIGAATASTTFFRQMGGTLGVAVFLSLLFSNVTGRIGDAFRVLTPTPEFQAALHDPAVLANPANQPVLAALRGGGGAGGVLQDSSFLQHADPLLARPFLVGFSSAMDTVFLLAAVVTAVAFVLIVTMKEVPLRTQSGIQARAADEAPAVPVP